MQNVTSESVSIPSYAVVHSLLATKYLAGSGLICVLWDHVLTFKDEVQYIWLRKQLDLVKIIFLMNRYSNEASLIYAAYIFAGLHGPEQLNQQVRYSSMPLTSELTVYMQSCVNFVTVIAVFAVISISTANVFMTLRHYVIWDRRRTAMIALWIAFAISYTIILVLFILTVLDVRKHALYSPILDTCTLSRKSYTLMGIWACMFAFDVFTLILAITNALERPYRHHVDVIINFKRDGAAFFLALTSLRLMNLAFSIWMGPEDTFLVSFFVWGMISLTLSRLILRVEHIRAQTSQTGGTGVHLFEMDQWRVERYDGGY
ncbi:hypothetical protein EW026_g7859 [Hermanssonia centrifuga]|uniref:DUF6533 domain-containing protein n=1 Tax=Hermanssonia centrifuga TaxID=98765 RepID=A0A4S4K6E2_9APHY|nr:hypothetical protein EW026_g7859 [Hermanssonia centrifuga]